MGRKLEFCRDKAMHTAMESFWAQGYEHTSMRDLAGRLGLHLGSVYNALGDKERVFENALKLHFDEYVMPQMTRLTQAENPLEAMDTLMSAVVDECCHQEDTPGCFIINSLLGITNINDSITTLLRGYMDKLEQSYTTCLEHAKTMGQISAAADPAALARFYMGSLFALRTMGKLKVPAQQLKDIQTCTMRTLRSA